MLQYGFKPKNLMGLYTKGLAKENGNVIDIFQNSWKLKTIRLLLQMPNTRRILHTYSSTVEILEN
jgi:hypothetical protein